MSSWWIFGRVLVGQSNGVEPVELVEPVQPPEPPEPPVVIPLSKKYTVCALTDADEANSRLSMLCISSGCQRGYSTVFRPKA